MDLKEFIYWLEDETKELVKLINENEILDNDRLEEMLSNLESIEKIRNNMMKIIDKEINKN